MFEKFPYSNFHDLNTDWLINKVKNVETSEANAKESEENAKTSELNAKEYELSAQGFALQANNHAQYAREQAQAAAQSAEDASNTVANTLAQVNLLQSRVDNIIPNQTQTEGNTELLDIRVGFTGVKYDSAGNAVRNDDELIHNNLIKLNENGYIKLYPTYEIGTIDNGVDASFNSAIRTIGIINYPNDIIIKCETGYRYMIAYYQQDGTFIRQTLLITNDTFIPKNTYFRVVIRKQPDQYLPTDSNLNVFYDHVNIYEYSKSSQNIDELKINALFNFETANYTTENGILNYLGTMYTGSDYYKHLTCDVTEGELLQISGYNALSDSFPLYLLMQDDTIVSYYHETVLANSYLTRKIIIPDNVNKIIVNVSTNLGSGNISKAGSNTDLFPDINELHYWKNKKIVWFGTSIPAGVVNAGESGGNGSYPVRIANKLGAIMYNEAVGSSRARGGNHSVATENDPLGWSGMSPIGILLSLSISSEEKQNFIDQWDTKWKDIVSDPSGTMDNLTPELIQNYKNSSWDIKLAKYLSTGSVGSCDLYVFDHGFNESVLPGMFDDMSDEPPVNDPDNRSYFLGAMSFLFKKILNDNPKAKILIIGHYLNATNQDGIKNGIGKCCEGQEKLAYLWGLPIIRTWEYLRLSNNIIVKNGQSMPVFKAYFPDGIHPASDPTGYALQYYAEMLYPHINNIR